MLAWAVVLRLIIAFADSGDWPCNEPTPKPSTKMVNFAQGVCHASILSGSTLRRPERCDEALSAGIAQEKLDTSEIGRRRGGGLPTSQLRVELTAPFRRPLWPTRWPESFNLVLSTTTMMRLVLSRPERTGFALRFQSAPHSPTQSTSHRLAFTAKLIHEI